MAKEQRSEGPVREMSDVVSVVGPGMEIVGDIKCDGTVRIEGKVEGSIRATKSVVIGKGGSVAGDIETQDVVIAGTVTGTVSGASRVELQETCKVEGDIRSRRVKLDEGGRVEGRLLMGTEAASREPQDRLVPGAEKRPPVAPESAPAPNLSATGSK